MTMSERIHERFADMELEDIEFADIIEDSLECDDIVPSVEQWLDESGSVPSMDEWLQEAKTAANADKIGMYLTHNGVVRATPKAVVRGGSVVPGADVVPGAAQDCSEDNAENGDCGQCKQENEVLGMEFSYHKKKVLSAIGETYELEGIYYVKVWMTSGELQVGDDIMYVLIGGDIRPHVVDALQFLVGKLKNECVYEREIFKKDTE